MFEEEFEAILESYINGNISWVKTEVANFSRSKLIDFTVYCMEAVDANFISREDYITIIG